MSPPGARTPCAVSRRPLTALPPSLATVPQGDGRREDPQRSPGSDRRAGPIDAQVLAGRALGRGGTRPPSLGPGRGPHTRRRPPPGDVQKDVDQVQGPSNLLERVRSPGAVNRGRQERGAQVPRPASSSPARAGEVDGDQGDGVSAPPRLPPSPICPTATGVSSTRAPQLTEDRFSDARVATHLFRVRALLML